MPLRHLDSAPNDFESVVGDWTVRHRRLKQRPTDVEYWIGFDVATKYPGNAGLKGIDHSGFAGRP